MSFYRMFVVAVAAFSLTAAVFAADDLNNAAQSPTMQSQQNLEVADADAQAAAVPMDQAKVDLNKATAKQLSKVKGLNAAKAKAIVSYRKKHGDFKSLDELKEVKALKNTKEEKMEQITDQLTVS